MKSYSVSGSLGFALAIGLSLGALGEAREPRRELKTLLRSVDWDRASQNRLEDLMHEINESGRDPDRFLSLGETHSQSEIDIPFQRKLAEQFFKASVSAGISPAESCVEHVTSANQSDPNHPGPLFFDFILKRSERKAKKAGTINQCLISHQVRFYYTGFQHQFRFSSDFKFEFRSELHEKMATTAEERGEEGIYVSVIDLSLLAVSDALTFIRSPFISREQFKAGIEGLEAEFAAVKAKMSRLEGALHGVAFRKGDLLFPSELTGTAWVYVTEHERIRGMKETFPLLARLANLPEPVLQWILDHEFRNPGVSQWGLAKMNPRMTATGTLKKVALAGIRKEFPVGSEHVILNHLPLRSILVATPGVPELRCFVQDKIHPRKGMTYRETTCDSVFARIP